MTVRKKVKKPAEVKERVDSMIRPAKNYREVTGTQQERFGVSLLFENYQSRTEANLIKRLDVLKWNHNILQTLESKGFIEKADWRISQTHYVRRLFMKPER